MARIIIAVLISLALGGGIGFYQGKQSADMHLREKLETAKKLFSIHEDPRFFTAVIKKIDGNLLRVEKSAVLNPLEEIPIREVIISGKTKIVRQITKTSKELKEEFATYQRLVEQGENTPPYPLPVKGVVGSAEDILIEQTILIRADEDIQEKKRFVADEITILSNSNP